MNYADPMVIEKFKNLPQKLKDVLFSEDTTDIIFAIGKENKLTVFQMEELADEAGLVVLGIKTPEDFVKSLEQRLATSAEKAVPIARATMEKIFNPILGDLKALHKSSAPLEMPSVVNVPLKKAPSTKPAEPQKQIVPAPIARSREQAKPAEIKKTPIPSPAKTLSLQKQPTAVTKSIEIPEALPIAPQPMVPKPVESIVLPTPKPTELPKTTPIVPKPTVPKLAVEPQIFTKAIPDPYREKLDNDGIVAVPVVKPKIVNWGDILKNKTKEPESHPDAKIALEKAMSDAPTVSKVADKALEKPKDQTSQTPKYTGMKDPYREPLD